MRLVLVRVDVHHRISQPWNVVEERRSNTLGDVVSRLHRDVRRDVDRQLRTQLVPTQRAFASDTCSTPGTAAADASIRRIVGSSMPSRTRRSAIRAAETSVMAIATVMSRPTMASERGNAASTPIAPATTPSEVNPSVRACWPSATRAAEPIAFPTRIR